MSSPSYAYDLRKSGLKAALGQMATSAATPPPSSPISAPTSYTRRIDRAQRTDQLTRELRAPGYTVQLTPAEVA